MVETFAVAGMTRRVGPSVIVLEDRIKEFLDSCTIVCCGSRLVTRLPDENDENEVFLMIPEGMHLRLTFAADLIKEPWCGEADPDEDAPST